MVPVAGDLDGIGRAVYLEPIITKRPAAALTTLLVLAGLSALVPGFLAARTQTPKCFGHRATIVGTNGNDHLRGTSGRDVIVGLGGNDGILARQGNDFVCAGPGDDVVHAAEGVNKMSGGPGDDWLDGRRAKGNVALAGSGADLVQAEGTITGGDGRDRIYSYGYLTPSSSPFPDTTDGGTGRDKIYGGSNGEVLKGGDQNDEIHAGSGNDRVEGNADDDVLNGDNGNDNIYGGSGTDTCAQGAGTGSVVGCEG